jgi:gas vesicle protein
MNKKKIAVGAALAAGAGYLAGILTAPKSGKETRKDIASTAVKAKIETEKQLKKGYSELQTLIGDAEEKIKKLKDKGGDELKKATEKAKVAKAKAKEMLSAVRTGETDDKNLEAALSEVKLAQKNLVKYLKKQ